MNFSRLSPALALVFVFACSHRPEPAAAKPVDISGFRMQSMDAGSPLAKLGIEAGDILQEINGVKLDNISAAQQALSQLSNEDHAEVKVIRDGKPLTLHYNVK